MGSIKGREEISSFFFFFPGEGGGGEGISARNVHLTILMVEHC